jgi:beta-fructofuranosidase
LVFSCLDRHSTPARRSEHGGTWAVNAPGVTGPFDVSTAYPLTSDDLYVGRLLRPRDSDEWLLFAFQNKGPAGVFTGGVTDPMPVRWEDGGLTVGPPDPGGSRPAADPSADQGAARRPATTSDGVS